MNHFQRKAHSLESAKQIVEEYFGLINNNNFTKEGSKD